MLFTNFPIKNLQILFSNNFRSLRFFLLLSVVKEVFFRKFWMFSIHYRFLIKSRLLWQGYSTWNLSATLIKMGNWNCISSHWYLLSEFLFRYEIPILHAIKTQSKLSWEKTIQPFWQSWSSCPVSLILANACYHLWLSNKCYKFISQSQGSPLII